MQSAHTPNSEPLGRPLKPEEKSLLKFFIRSCADFGHIEKQLEQYRVQEMTDGGMGSVRVVSGHGNYRNKFSREACERTFEDSDGVPISVSVNLDQNDQLFEIDIWKVDFSPVKIHPGKTVEAPRV